MDVFLEEVKPTLAILTSKHQARMQESQCVVKEDLGSRESMWETPQSPPDCVWYVGTGNNTSKHNGTSPGQVRPWSMEALFLEDKELVT